MFRKIISLFGTEGKANNGRKVRPTLTESYEYSTDTLRHIQQELRCLYRLTRVAAYCDQKPPLLKESSLSCIQSFVRDLVAFYHLQFTIPSPIVAVAVASQREGKGGSVELAPGTNTESRIYIEIDPLFRYNCDAINWIIAHELAHVVLDSVNLHNSDHHDNEVLVDLLVLWIGYGSIMSHMRSNSSSTLGDMSEAQLCCATTLREMRYGALCKYSVHSHAARRV